MVVRLMSEDRPPEQRRSGDGARPALPDPGERSVTILPTSPGPPLRLSREDVDKITRAVERSRRERRDGTHG